MNRLKMKLRFTLFQLVLWAVLIPGQMRAGSEEIARNQWQSIQQMEEGPDRVHQEEAYFDHWAQSDAKTLTTVARSYFEELVRHKRDHKRNYLDRIKGGGHPQGAKLERFIQSLAARGMSFEKALATIVQGSVEIVLTSHPTQIQSMSYRLLWQLHERIKDAQEAIQAGDRESALIYIHSAQRLGIELTKKEILNWQETLDDLRDQQRVEAVAKRWSENWLPEIDRKLREVHPGNPVKLTVEEEARETAEVYLPNLYWALPRVRKTFVEAMKQAYEHRSGYNPLKVKEVAEKIIQISSWAWDADGKAMVKADTMRVSNSIQQAAIYRLHEQRLEVISDLFPYEPLQALKTAFNRHSRDLEKNSNSTLIIDPPTKLGAELEIDFQSPSSRVRSYFSSWIFRIINELQKTAGNSGLIRSLEDLLFEVKVFHLNNHVRQNIEVVHKALQGQAQKNPVFETEIQRLTVLAEDPGRHGAFITADTKTAEDTDAALQLLESANLTGRVRYFPLIENMDSFRKLPILVEYWLRPGSLMRHHMIQRSRLTSEPPTLNIMFALSDTNRLGSQAATHLMEIMGAEARKAVEKLSHQYPVTQEEGLQGARGSFRLRIFWGGGSQLARGGDWISHEKPIYTDQGNARDLKYDSPDMAAIRMDRHLEAGIRQAYLTDHRPGQDFHSFNKDDEQLTQLIAKREARYHELFFDRLGYRNIMEAYLLFGSMLSEARSNSYGARPTSRIEDTGSVPQLLHRLFDRFFINSHGTSFEALLNEKGLPQMMQMRLKSLWAQLRPNSPYALPSIDQRAITIDNTFSETKFNQLAKSVEAEEELGITLETSARWMQLNSPHFRSYRRQKVAEVLATSMANLDSHSSRLPKSLRDSLDDESAQHFLLAGRGKLPDEVTVQDLVGVFSYIHQTARRVENRNHQLAQYISLNGSNDSNPLAEAHSYTQSSVVKDQKHFVRFGQALLGWIHRHSTFGNAENGPRDLRVLFPKLYADGLESGKNQANDSLNQLEFLAWAIHYEGQQHPLSVNELSSEASGN